ncbi:hypothetical protein Q7P36_007481 [Cladosporium allicinum]
MHADFVTAESFGFPTAKRLSSKSTIGLVDLGWHRLGPASRSCVQLQGSCLYFLQFACKEVQSRLLVVPVFRTNAVLNLSDQLELLDDAEEDVVESKTSFDELGTGILVAFAMILERFAVPVDGEVDGCYNSQAEAYWLLEGHGGPVVSVSFSHDDKRLVSASSDRTVVEWDVATMRKVGTVKKFEVPVVSARCSREDDSLAVIYGGGVFDDARGVQVWTKNKKDKKRNPWTMHRNHSFSSRVFSAFVGSDWAAALQFEDVDNGSPFTKRYFKHGTPHAHGVATSDLLWVNGSVPSDNDVQINPDSGETAFAIRGENSIFVLTKVPKPPKIRKHP